jgi:hypothetical protein
MAWAFDEFVSRFPPTAAIIVREWHVQLQTIDANITVEGGSIGREQDPPAIHVHLRFTGIHAAAIQFERSHVFTAERCSVSSSDPRLWFNGPTGALFCGAAVPDALSFLIDCADDLRRIGAPADLRRYAVADSFRSLVRRLELNEYGPIIGPLIVLDTIAKRLSEYGVSWRIEPSSSRSEKSYPRLLLVQLGASWIACETISMDEPENASGETL